jgi:hypothetical protein
MGSALRSKYGKDIDFKQGYWTPPLSALEVYESEKAQIENVLGLARPDFTYRSRRHRSERPCSINRHVRKFRFHSSGQCRLATRPSFTWAFTTSRGQSATAIAHELGHYTKEPKPGRLAELLEMLSEFPETLVVLNHPLWDIEFAGQKRHEATLSSLLEAHGERFHALEVNGYRRWRENRRVTQLAESIGLPIVSGGDRHGRDTNAILNLTARRYALRLHLGSARREDERSGAHARLCRTANRAPTKRICRCGAVLSRLSCRTGALV